MSSDVHYLDGTCRCGHSVEHHDGGECWTNAAGHEIWTTPDEGKCECDGFEVAP